MLIAATFAFRLVVHFFMDYKLLAHMVAHWQVLSKRRFYLLYDRLDNRKLMQALDPRFKEHPSLFTSYLQDHNQNREHAYTQFWQPYRTTLDAVFGLTWPLLLIPMIGVWEGGYGLHALWLLLTPLCLIALAYVEYRIRTPEGRQEREAINQLAEISESVRRRPWE